mmetsp:Transcript_17730/g.36014  ORF Transcript_17730/g.36014 Transcript_17730/m.36014 type:complete len:367 (+) Transcript_17730:229-1329(+)
MGTAPLVLPVNAVGASVARFAVAFLLSVLTHTLPPTLCTVIPLLSVNAHTFPSTLLALRLLISVLADPLPPALFAEISLAAVLAPRLEASSLFCRIRHDCTRSLVMQLHLPSMRMRMSMCVCMGMGMCVHVGLHGEGACCSSCSSPRVCLHRLYLLYVGGWVEVVRGVQQQLTTSLLFSDAFDVLLALSAGVLALFVLTQTAAPTLDTAALVSSVNAVHAFPSPYAQLAIVTVLAVFANSLAPTLRAIVLFLLVNAHPSPPARSALGFLETMGTDPFPPTLSALILLPTVCADATTSAILAPVALSIVLTKAHSPTVTAEVTLLAVLALLKHADLSAILPDGGAPPLVLCLRGLSSRECTFVYEFF